MAEAHKTTRPLFSNNLLEAARILVFRIGELGDTIISLPALSAVREAFPNAHIALLGNVDAEGRNVTVREILPANDLVDEWISYASTEQGLTGSLRLLLTLRRSRFDTLVYLVPRIRSSKDIRRDLLFFRLAGMRRILGAKGFEPLPRSAAGTLLPVAQEADHLLHRLSLDGLAVPGPGEAQLALALTAEEEARARVWMAENAPQHGTLLGVGPGSKWPSKIWPEERFAAVVRSVIGKQQNTFPIVFGGPEDRALGDRLLAKWRTGANAAGVLPVRVAAAVLASCRMYLGNDTGTMHLAAAVGTPCVVIMSALDWPGHWNPYGEGHVVLRRSVPCEGCLLKICEREGMRCLKEISVEEVVQACMKKLIALSTQYAAHTDNKYQTQRSQGRVRVESV